MIPVNDRENFFEKNKDKVPYLMFSLSLLALVFGTILTLANAYSYSKLEPLKDSLDKINGNVYAINQTDSEQQILIKQNTQLIKGLNDNLIEMRTTHDDILRNENSMVQQINALYLKLIR